MRYIGIDAPEIDHENNRDNVNIDDNSDDINNNIKDKIKITIRAIKECTIFDNKNTLKAIIPTIIKITLTITSTLLLYNIKIYLSTSPNTIS